MLMVCLAALHSLKRVYFGGFFIRGHPYTMETISFAFKFWSKVGYAADRTGCSCST